MPKFLACPGCGVARLLLKRCLACKTGALPVLMTRSAALEVREAYRTREEAQAQEMPRMTPAEREQALEMFFGPKEW